MRFPKETYLYKEVGYKYHMCSDSIDGVAIAGRKKRVGIYRLVGEGIVAYPNGEEPMLIRDDCAKKAKAARGAR